MRKLKLQVQISIDGYIAGPNGEMDWLAWNWGEDISSYVTALTESVDTILLGRKLAEGFIPHWTSVTENQDAPEYSFGKIMIDTPKVVFSKTYESSIWNNTDVANGELVEEVNGIKSMAGKDIIIYGGANFVSNLIHANLIDEYHLFINPAAIGMGMPIFTDKTKLSLIQSQAFSCGIVVNQYIPCI